MSDDIHFDFGRIERIGFAEAVLCAGKRVDQIERILDEVGSKSESVLLTRLSQSVFQKLGPTYREALDFDASSATAFFGAPAPLEPHARVAVVAAGTSDAGVAAEAVRTLRFHGANCEQFVDVGVAGLWRLERHVDALAAFDVIVVVAGMDGALPSVIGGLFGSLVVAVPTSTGYGAARRGETALHAALASCAPGIVVVNIDNGYGAGIAALRALRTRRREQ